MHTDSKTLGYLNANPHVLISRQQNRIGDCMIARKLYKIRHYQRVHPLLLPKWVQNAKSRLHAVGVC